MSIIMFLLFFVLLLSSTPIAIVLGFTTLLAAIFLTEIPIYMVPQMMFSALDSFIILAVPMFILTGDIVGNGRTAKKLIDFSKSLLGQMAGGLGITTILACMVFSAITGSSLTGIVAIGAVMFPALIKANYEKNFSLGLITASSSLGILIPPSIPMIIYALVMGVSVGHVFMAGFGPGIVIGLVFMGYSWYLAKRNGWIGEKRSSWSVVLHKAKDGIWALMLPIIVLGGIYGGIFTTTEAAAVSVIYSLFIELFIYRSMNFSKFFSIVKNSAVLSGCLLFIFSCGTTFSWFLTNQQIPHKMAEFVLGFITQPWMFLLGVNILLLIVGFFLDIASAILIFGPIFYPLIISYNIDPVHFGIIMILNLELGFLTPPVGFNLFVASSATKASILEVSRSVLPFIVILLVCLILITYFPSISMVLPKLILGD